MAKTVVAPLTLVVFAACALSAPAAVERGAPTKTFDKSNFTIAAVRAGPVGWSAPGKEYSDVANWSSTNLNLTGTVDLGIALIEKAAAAGSALIAFPELWFPGYPVDINFSPTWLKTNTRHYIANSLVYGSPEWNKIIAAVKANGIYTALGFSEKKGKHVYMAQALIGPDGKVLIHRHKLRPSGGERSFWSDGLIDELKVVSTPYGRMGMLECWEYFHPSMTFDMLAQKEDIHIAAFPNIPDDYTEPLWFTTGEANGGVTRTYAINSGAITVMSAVGSSRIYSGTGMNLSTSSSYTSFETQPLIFSSINTTAFTIEKYNVNGEESWGVLQQIKNGFPSYIPKVTGTFVPRKMNDIRQWL